MSNITKNYKLRMWIDENIIISDTDPNADYKTAIWNDSYASMQVRVIGGLKEMNMPLAITTTGSENGVTYIDTQLNNYYAEAAAANVNSVEGEDDILGDIANSDNIVLEVSSDNPNILFSYRDDKETFFNTDFSSKLIINYELNTEENVNQRIFLKTADGSTNTSDIKFKLIKNNQLEQDLVSVQNVYGAGYCISKGYNKLSDCMIAQENLNKTVEHSRTLINAKGTPNFNKTSPARIYELDEVKVENINLSLSGDNNAVLSISNQYSLKSNEGAFSLIPTTQYSITSSITQYVSDSQNHYYTCGNGVINYCNTFYEILESNFDEQTNTFTITKAKVYSAKLKNVERTEFGLYKSTDDEGDVYYYRGEVNNNYVDFAGKLWRIIRTNGDGSIRLILNDNIGKSIYSINSNSPSYVGYMQPEVSENANVEDNFLNEVNSEIKNEIDTWYEINIKDKTYENYLADSIFCNNRKVVLNSNGTITFGAMDRSAVAGMIKKPTLLCSNSRDRFTTNLKNIGNQKNTYPIGLITADEVSMAGGMGGTSSVVVNFDFYLYDDENFWTMTPLRFMGSSSMLNVSNKGELTFKSTDTESGVRPVLSLRSDIEIVSGNGSLENPFELQLPN